MQPVLKVYRNITRLSLLGEQGAIVRRSLLDCLPKLLLSGALVQGVVCSVVAGLQEDGNGSGEGEDSASGCAGRDGGSEGDMMCRNLERSIARRLVVLLLKCACLLEDQG